MFVFGKELGELCTDFTVNSFKTFVKNVMDVIKTMSQGKPCSSNKESLNTL